MFNPRTPVAALKAYETGFNPLEMFIFKSGSAKPLNEEPFDIEAIERYLSRQDLNLEANSILVSIFEKLIYSQDQELALFAAESINIIENRYNNRIEEAKKALEKKKSNKYFIELGRLFYELAIINRSRESIKKFYFRESYKYYTSVRKTQKLSFDDLETIVRILLELKLYKNALDLFERERGETGTEHLYLQAEIEFRMGNYSNVAKICSRLLENIDDLPDRKRDQVIYWMRVE